MHLKKLLTTIKFLVTKPFREFKLFNRKNSKIAIKGSVIPIFLFNLRQECRWRQGSEIATGFDSALVHGQARPKRGREEVWQQNQLKHKLTSGTRIKEAQRKTKLRREINCALLESARGECLAILMSRRGIWRMINF